MQRECRRYSPFIIVEVIRKLSLISLTNDQPNSSRGGPRSSARSPRLDVAPGSGRGLQLVPTPCLAGAAGDARCCFSQSARRDIAWSRRGRQSIGNSPAPVSYRIACYSSIFHHFLSYREVFYSSCLGTGNSRTGRI